MNAAATIVWFRQDLRLQDNPALHAAFARGGPVVPVFILDDAAEGPWKMGEASRWWLHHSLAPLDASLRERGTRLFLGQGESEKILVNWVREAKADAVYWNRRYEPKAVIRDRTVERTFTKSGIEVRTFNGSLLNEPGAVANKQGKPFQVFTPYWRHCLTLPVAPPTKLTAGRWPRTTRLLGSLKLDDLNLRPKVRWDALFYEEWMPGEAGAAQRLRKFVRRGMNGYDVGRDRMGEKGTSRLSPHLHFGEISPRQIWAAVKRASRASGVFPPNRGASIFLNEIGWREFAHHLVFHFPTTPELPLRAEFAKFPWAFDPKGLNVRAWQQGRTGYPIVDAAMRQLWAIGWMHNRARMIVASFLVKHLRLSWRAGADWFWDTLVDADLANNTLGWQWSAGCGADAAPYFRVFNPVLQGMKFDGSGDYVRRWVPELAAVPLRYIHAPWSAPAAELRAAGVVLGETYPRPIVDHATARNEALAAFKQFRGAGRAEKKEKGRRG